MIGFIRIREDLLDGPAGFQRYVHRRGASATPYDDVIGFVFLLNLLVVLPIGRIGVLPVRDAATEHMLVAHIRFNVAQTDGKPIAVKIRKSRRPERHHMLLVGKYTTM